VIEDPMERPEDRQLKLGFRQCPITQDSVKRASPGTGILFDERSPTADQLSIEANFLFSQWISSKKKLAEALRQHSGAGHLRVPLATLPETRFSEPDISKWALQRCFRECLLSDVAENEASFSYDQ
jgi:hypothetical protein